MFLISENTLEPDNLNFKKSNCFQLHWCVHLNECWHICLDRVIRKSYFIIMLRLIWAWPGNGYQFKPRVYMRVASKFACLLQNTDCQEYMCVYYKSVKPKHSFILQNEKSSYYSHLNWWFGDWTQRCRHAFCQCCESGHLSDVIFYSFDWHLFCLVVFFVFCSFFFFYGKNVIFLKRMLSLVNICLHAVCLGNWLISQLLLESCSKNQKLQAILLLMTGVTSSGLHIMAM